jgi:hypothetical protein
MVELRETWFPLCCATSCGHAARSTLAETMSVASPQNPRQRRPEFAGMAAADGFQDWGGVPEVPKLYGPCRSRRPYARLAIAGWHRPW